jgi:ABC-type nitrate/sulfonate/bicarbonate transport system permease component
MMKKVWVIQTITVVILLLLWEVIGRSGLILPEVFPPFSQVIWEMFSLLFSGTLGPHVAATVYEILVGFVAGGIMGLVLGAIFGSNLYLYRLFEPLFYYFSAIPKIILFPILLLFLGTGIESKMGMAAVSAFFPVVVNTALSILEVKSIYIRAAKTLGASRSQIYFKVYLPSMLGPILAGMRLGLGVAITGALLAETVIAKNGLGFKTIQYYSQLRIAEMYALILLIFIGAFAVNALVSKWIQKSSRHEGNNGQNLFS